MCKYLLAVLLAFTLSCSAEEKQSVKVSHKGYGDNTVTGFIDAFLDGYGYWETDVRLRGGKAVLLHDDVPCDNCDELYTLLSLARHWSITVFIEIKEMEAVAEAVEVVNDNLGVDVIFISFDAKILRELNTMTNFPIGLIATYGRDESQVDSFIDWMLISKSYIDKCIPHLKCAAWTIINETDFNNVNGKVDAIIMDRY